MSIRSCGSGDEAGAVASRDDDDDAIDVRLVALILGVSVPTVWRQVESGDLPLPFYPAPRTPRWTRKEIREVRDRRRMLPREAMAARRARRLAREATGLLQATCGVAEGQRVSELKVPLEKTRAIPAQQKAKLRAAKNPAGKAVE
jgi:predicted DNA-binding transcriptional regulator AlpA